MARDPHAYAAYYRESYWSRAFPAVALSILVIFFLHRSPLHERLIVFAIVGGIWLMGWAGAAQFERIVALRVSSAGITVRVRQEDKKTRASLPWNDIEYLVIWHDEETTSLSVQPFGGTVQPVLMRRSNPEPSNYVTLKAKALDEQRLLSAVARYGPAVQIVDGNTGSPVAGSPSVHRTNIMSRRSRSQELTQMWRNDFR
jgi:hypothetical protein